MTHPAVAAPAATTAKHAANHAFPNLGLYPPAMQQQMAAHFQALAQQQQQQQQTQPESTGQVNGGGDANSGLPTFSQVWASQQQQVNPVVAGLVQQANSAQARAQYTQQQQLQLQQQQQQQQAQAQAQAQAEQQRQASSESQAQPQQQQQAVQISVGADGQLIQTPVYQAQQPDTPAGTTTAQWQWHQAAATPEQQQQALDQQQQVQQQAQSTEQQPQAGTPTHSEASQSAEADSTPHVAESSNGGATTTAADTTAAVGENGPVSTAQTTTVASAHNLYNSYQYNPWNAYPNTGQFGADGKAVDSKESILEKELQHLKLALSEKTKDVERLTAELEKAYAIIEQLKQHNQALGAAAQNLGNGHNDAAALLAAAAQQQVSMAAVVATTATATSAQQS